MDEIKNVAETLLEKMPQPIIGAVELDALLKHQLPVLHTPTGYTSRVLDNLERHLPVPLRKQGTVVLDEPESFIWFAQKHGSPESSHIYLSADYVQGKVAFTAVLNDHDAAAPAWRDFRATFTPAKTLEWARWTDMNAKGFSQVEFANWLEDNAADIAAVECMPTASQMLEMALTFEAAAEKKFKSGVRLQSGGVQLEYIDTEDAATRSKMAMFERFALGIAPFQGGPAYRLDARLKYRITDGNLKLWFELIRPDKVLEAAARDLVEKIRAEAGLQLLAGSPGN